MPARHPIRKSESSRATTADPRPGRHAGRESFAPQWLKSRGTASDVKGMTASPGLSRLHVPGYPPPAPAARPWLVHWLETVSDLEALRATHPMMDAVIDEVDGRMIRIGDRWLADFASCNYLGFDLDREIIEAVPAYLDAWGTHPSWSRLLGSPALYEDIEERLTDLVGAEDTLLLPTITHIHMSVIPLLAASGTIFMDARAHKTIYDGCQVAR